MKKNLNISSHRLRMHAVFIVMSHNMLFLDLTLSAVDLKTRGKFNCGNNRDHLGVLMRIVSSYEGSRIVCVEGSYQCLSHMEEI